MSRWLEVAVNARNSPLASDSTQAELDLVAGATRMQYIVVVLIINDLHWHAAFIRLREDRANAFTQSATFATNRNTMNVRELGRVCRDEQAEGPAKFGFTWCLPDGTRLLSRVESGGCRGLGAAGSPGGNSPTFTKSINGVSS